ncbi:2-carboxy-1,4-naphthoquinone phytyltransferase, chloroplastic isoform X1 [Dendrobium catenatum]|uniref:1,4-dihydroxy-2-naphthoate polyprenyltransferase, chloroplastic n=1 Tax=Dendrobium catenatum TaxID=906689 RepID=A0A2I0X9Y2_9ASPA|nr:2-carboxy-1,4-naphthoquinone phytyltransferase, chloroplastic isoform X1 [Dendrobium catenatum]PKU84728.1 1,4-dihydroxy-2-naphthoate polyprenyltransferase, chloroplastic [Dendrobium catenatum]
MASVGAGTLHHPSLLPLVSDLCHRPPLCYRVSQQAISCKKWKTKVKIHGRLPALKCSSQPQTIRLTTGEKEEGEEAEISRMTLIWRAAKLPIYSVALVPLTVGSAAAYFQTGFFSTRRYFLLLFASVLIIAWLNLSNDVYDYDTGVDRNKKESVINIIGSQTATHFAAITFLVFGFMGLIWACAEAGDIRFILLATSAILCGYIYQCPPFRLSYQGLGEPLCFAAFGPFATTAFYFSQSSKNLTSGMNHLSLSATVLCASVLVGLTTTFILFCSHFHQIDGDAAVGKMSPLVRIGTETGSKLIRIGILALYILLFTFSACKYIPLTCSFLCAITIPLAKLVMDYVEQNHNNKLKIFMAKYYCVRLHSLFGAALAVGLVVARGGVQLYNIG